MTVNEVAREFADQFSNALIAEADLMMLQPPESGDASQIILRHRERKRLEEIRRCSNCMWCSASNECFEGRWYHTPKKMVNPGWFGCGRHLRRK